MSPGIAAIESESPTEPREWKIVILGPAPDFQETTGKGVDALQVLWQIHRLIWKAEVAFDS
jgi:hypothetical protein